MRRSHRYLAGVCPYAEANARKKWYFETPAAAASSRKFSGSEYKRSMRSRARRTCSNKSVGTGNVAREVAIARRVAARRQRLTLGVASSTPDLKSIFPRWVHSRRELVALVLHHVSYG